MNESSDPLKTIAAVLGRLEERTGNIQDGVDKIEQHQETQNGRLSVLEGWVQKILGGAILLSLMSPLFVLGIRESIYDLFK